MSCHKRFLAVEWDHHTWRTHVASSEVLTMSETNIWCRVVDKPYVRCDKEEVCAVCGKAGRRWSCICDMEVAERCTLLKASAPTAIDAQGASRPVVT